MLSWKSISVMAVSTFVLVTYTQGFWTAPAPAAAPPVAPQVPAPVQTVLRDDLAEVRAELAWQRAQVADVARAGADSPSGAPAPADQPVSASSDGLAPYLAPTEPLMPTAGPVAARWAPLDTAVRTAAAGLDGRMSVVAVDLTTGDRYEFRPADRYYPASTFKLPVCLCTVEAIERGELSWETPVTFTKEDDDTVGQGGFATAPYGSQWTVRNLHDRSIISSNNVAVKMLARTLTWDGLAACTEKIGGRVTRTEEGSTAVRATDEAAWWLHLWQLKQERPAVAENLLRPLRAVTYWGRIQAGTPRPELVTHKFGTYPPYEHDGAIIWGEKPYLLVVMTYTTDHAAADATIAQVARAAWDATYSTARP